MKKLVFVVLVAVGLSSFAQAAGDATAGKAKVATCGACHGADGNSAIPNFPKLAGQNERYLVKQLLDIQCGYLSPEQQKAEKCNARSIPEMTGQLNGMNEQDFADMAAYYATQTGSVGQAKADLAAKGEEIYRAGIRSKGVSACTGCHSPTGKGNSPAGFPMLSGQHADYIAGQLKAFRSAADGRMGRANDGDSKIMRDIAQGMSDAEIEAVASYISGLY